MTSTRGAADDAPAKTARRSAARQDRGMALATVGGVLLATTLLGTVVAFAAGPQLAIDASCGKLPGVQVDVKQRAAEIEARALRAVEGEPVDRDQVCQDFHWAQIQKVRLAVGGEADAVLPGQSEEASLERYNQLGAMAWTAWQASKPPSRGPVAELRADLSHEYAEADSWLYLDDLEENLGFYAEDLDRVPVLDETLADREGQAKLAAAVLNHPRVPPALQAAAETVSFNVHQDRKALGALGAAHGDKFQRFARTLTVHQDRSLAKLSRAQAPLRDLQTQARGVQGDIDAALQDIKATPDAYYQKEEAYFAPGKNGRAVLRHAAALNTTAASAEGALERAGEPAVLGRVAPSFSWGNGAQSSVEALLERREAAAAVERAATRELAGIDDALGVATQYKIRDLT